MLGPTVSFMRKPLIISLVCLLAIGCNRKKNETVHYDLEMKDGPTCLVYVEFRDAGEADEFFNVAKDFATSFGIPESHVRAMSDRSSPVFRSGPIYRTERVVISSTAVLVQDYPYGQCRMSVLRRDVAPEDFKRLADAFAEIFKQVFTNRVQYSFEEAPK